MSKNDNPRSVVLWILWATMLVAMVMYQFQLGGGIPAGRDLPGEQAIGLEITSTVFIGFATLIRWLMIPRAVGGRNLLILMIAGVALSETVTFYEIFLLPRSMPHTRLEYFVVSILSALQFAPFYGKQLVAPDTAHT
jgi:hypothetical protein